MKEYLKTKDDIKAVRFAITLARVLDEAERSIKTGKPQFVQASHEVTTRTGLSLWHNVDDDTYYWQDLYRNNSVTYSNRVSALKALLDEVIEWEA